jgi:chromosome segregation ATPase
MDLEIAEAKVTLQSAAAENDDLRRTLAVAEEQVRALTASLAEVTQEAEVFRREAGELRLRMEALGAEGGSGERSKLEGRLLRAVSDLRLAENDKDRLSNQLLRLSEATLAFLRTAEGGEAEARMAVETELRATNEALGLAPETAKEAEPVSATLTDAMVISVKEELALAVANVGRVHGVQVGMPFQVWRGASQVGTVRVVDVRERISGAVIQEIRDGEGPLKVGDRLKVDAR